MEKQSSYLKYGLAILISLIIAHFASDVCYIIYDKISVIRTFILFILVFTLSFMTFIKMYSNFYEKRLYKNYPMSDKVFLVFILILLILPASHINKYLGSALENRSLNEYKPFFIIENNKVSINLNYGNDFNEWFNDRFFLRNFYYVLANLKYLLSECWENDVVIQAKDNWMFLKLDNRVAEYQNLNLISTSEIRTIAEYFSVINDYCRLHNKKFYLIIIPDKNKIYGEYMPTYILKRNPDSNSNVSRIYKYLKANTDIQVIYPYDYYMNNKNLGLFYYKTDTHWNDLGASYVYDTLMSNIQNDKINILPVNYNRFIQHKRASQGDIQNKLPQINRKPDTYKYIKYEIPKNYEIQYSTVPLDNPSWMVPKIVTTNKNLNNKKLLMYRDSFATALMPFLSNTFEQVIYRWTHQISKSEIDNADIVIFETVERGLTDILTCKEKL